MHLRSVANRNLSLYTFWSGNESDALIIIRRYWRMTAGVLVQYRFRFIQFECINWMEENGKEQCIAIKSTKTIWKQICKINVLQKTKTKCWRFAITNWANVLQMIFDSYVAFSYGGNWREMRSLIFNFILFALTACNGNGASKEKRKRNKNISDWASRTTQYCSIIRMKSRQWKFHKHILFIIFFSARAYFSTSSSSCLSFRVIMLMKLSSTFEYFIR